MDFFNTRTHTHTHTQWALLSITVRNRFKNKNKLSPQLDLFCLSRSHSDNQLLNHKVLQLLQSGRWGNVLTVTLCLPRSDRIQSFWMPTDFVKCPVHSIRLLRKKLWHLAGHCRYYFIYTFSGCACVCM